jgi:hypothetical protein
MFSMKHLLMGVYQVCANKSPWVKLALQRWGGGGGWGAYIQVSDLRAIMALLFADMEGSSTNIVCDKCGKAFGSRTNLYDHTKRHLGQGPYKCCGKTFYSRANLKRHRYGVFLFISKFYWHSNISPPDFIT